MIYVSSWYEMKMAGGEPSIKKNSKKRLKNLRRGLNPRLCECTQKVWKSCGLQVKRRFHSPMLVRATRSTKTILTAILASLSCPGVTAGYPGPRPTALYRAATPSRHPLVHLLTSAENTSSKLATPSDSWETSTSFHLHFLVGWHVELVQVLLQSL